MFETKQVRYENPELVEWDPPGREWCDKLLADGVDPAEVRKIARRPKDERRVRLGDLTAEGIEDFEYIYDFGDDWVHRIVIERVEKVEVGRLPALIDGACSGPPEDCGGLPGYEQIQDAYAGRPVDGWGRELAEWARSRMGPAWTPETFDAELIRDCLSRTWRGPRR